MNVLQTKDHVEGLLNATRVSALLEVDQYLQDNDDEQITVIDLVEKMKERCGAPGY